MAIRSRRREVEIEIDQTLPAVQEELPDVVRIRYAVGEDWSGDPAVYFRVTLSDEALLQRDLGELTGSIAGTLFEKLGFSESDYIPYFHFRSKAEQDELQDPAWA